MNDVTNILGPHCHFDLWQKHKFKTFVFDDTKGALDFTKIMKLFQFFFRKATKIYFFEEDQIKLSFAPKKSVECKLAYIQSSIELRA